MPLPISATEPALVGSLELVFTLNAPRDRVWKAIVDETARWWRADFFVGSRAKAMLFEAQVGGRFWEDWGNGEGVLWGTVVLVDAPRAFDLSCVITAAYGGPRHSMLHVELEEKNGVTTLRLTDSMHGRIEGNLLENLAAGWTMLFGESLTKYVEGKKV